MMVKDKERQSVASSLERKDSKETSKDLKEIKKIKTLEFDNSDGFVCDINTGICGPVGQKEEDRK